METVAATASAFLLPICLLKNSLISGSSLSLLVSLLGSFDLAYVQRTQSGAWNHNSTKWRATFCMDKKKEPYLICWLASRWCRWPVTSAVYGIQESERTVAGWTCPSSGPDDLRLDYWQTNPRAPFESVDTRLVSTRKRENQNEIIFVTTYVSFPGKFLRGSFIKTQWINKYNKIKQVKKLWPT